MTASEFVMYRFFDAKDRLLYVGITLSPDQRFRAHRADKSWWREVVTIKLERHADIESLAQAEVAAIEAERPKYNRAHAIPPETIGKSRGSQPLWPAASRFCTDGPPAAPAPTKPVPMRLPFPCHVCGAMLTQRGADALIICTTCETGEMAEGITRACYDQRNFLGR